MKMGEMCRVVHFFLGWGRVIIFMYTMPFEKISISFPYLFQSGYSPCPLALLSCRKKAGMDTA